MPRPGPQGQRVNLHRPPRTLFHVKQRLRAPLCRCGPLPRLRPPSVGAGPVPHKRGRQRVTRRCARMRGFEPLTRLGLFHVKQRRFFPPAASAPLYPGKGSARCGRQGALRRWVSKWGRSPPRCAPSVVIGQVRPTAPLPACGHVSRETKPGTQKPAAEQRSAAGSGSCRQAGGRAAGVIRSLCRSPRPGPLRWSRSRRRRPRGRVRRRFRRRRPRRGGRGPGRSPCSARPHA